MLRVEGLSKQQQNIISTLGLKDSKDFQVLGILHLLH